MTGIIAKVTGRFQYRCEAALKVWLFDTAVRIRSRASGETESNSGISIFRSAMDSVSPDARERILTAVSDRKSTRLNSSHMSISYAVFCLKKKKHTHNLNFPQHNRKSPLPAHTPHRTPPTRYDQATIAPPLVVHPYACAPTCPRSATKPDA